MYISEASLIENEFTLRNLKLTDQILETRRASARWLALSLGIINPGESRQSAIAVLDALVNFQFIRNTDPTVKELQEYITSNWEEINEKTLRYHLLRMKNMGYIENASGKFYFTHPESGNRFDPENWIRFVFESKFTEAASKIGKVIKDLKNKPPTR